MLEKFSLPLIILLSLSMIAASCSQVERRMANKQNALGKTNEITVIADETVWEGAIADSLAYYFASAYPVMPQPEPLFDLRHFTVGQLEADRLRRELRTYLVLADLSEEDSPAARMTAAAIGEEAVRECREGKAYGTHLARDRWAQGQIIFFLYGFGEDKLAQAIREKYPAIASRVHQHDSEQLAAATYLNQINRRHSDSLQRALGLEINIPGEFFVASADSSTFWLRSEYTESSHNIILHRLEYREESQLSQPYIQELRDSLVRRLVRTGTPGSVMTVNDRDLPLLFYEKEINGHYCLEMRGVWEMSDDYMGGPFFSYLIAVPEHRTLVFADLWVYAPGKEKRDYMQRLEHIVSGIKFSR